MMNAIYLADLVIIILFKVNWAKTLKYFRTIKTKKQIFLIIILLKKKKINAVTWFGCWGTIHVACLGKELPGGACHRFEFTIFLLEIKEPSLPYNLPIAGGKIVGFLFFPGVLVLCEMQTALCGVWT